MCLYPAAFVFSQKIAEPFSGFELRPIDGKTVLPPAATLLKYPIKVRILSPEILSEVCKLHILFEKDHKNVLLRLWPPDGAAPKGHHK